MNKKVHIEWEMPVFASHHYSIASEIALSTYPSAKIQMINKCVSIGCSTDFLDGYTGLDMNFYNAQPENFDNIESHKIDLRYAFKVCSKAIHKMLEDGFYIFFSGIDDYYIPGKSWYKTKHRLHDGIICGYDDRAGTYDMIAYNIDWRLCEFKVRQKDFLKSVSEGIKRYPDTYILGIKAAEKKVEFNVLDAINQMYYFLHLKPQYTPEYRGFIWGRATYNYFVMYMDKILDGSIPYEKMDWRPMRIVWEFRVRNLERIIAIEKAMNYDHSVSERYKTVVEESNRLRFLYAFYHKKRNDNLLRSVRNGVDELQFVERELYLELIDRYNETK